MIIPVVTLAKATSSRIESFEVYLFDHFSLPALIVILIFIFNLLALFVFKCIFYKDFYLMWSSEFCGLNFAVCVPVR